MIFFFSSSFSLARFSRVGVRSITPSGGTRYWTTRETLLKGGDNYFSVSYSIIIISNNLICCFSCYIVTFYFLHVCTVCFTFHECIHFTCFLLKKNTHQYILHYAHRGYFLADSRRCWTSRISSLSIETASTSGHCSSGCAQATIAFPRVRLLKGGGGNYYYQCLIINNFKSAYY